MTKLGVNTGFGGSADTRTTKSESLKHDLLNSLLNGMLGDATPTARLTAFLPLDHKERMSMPESWARAAMLIRINSLARIAFDCSGSDVAFERKCNSKNTSTR